jgi:hypothetical protein
MLLKMVISSSKVGGFTDGPGLFRWACSELNIHQDYEIGRIHITENIWDIRVFFG